MFLTKGNSHFHERRNCHELDTCRKVLAMREAPAGLEPCARCCGSQLVARSAKVRVREADNSDSESQSSEVNGRFRPSGSGRELFTTRSGKYYHEDKFCWYLSNATTVTRVSVAPSRLLACPQCVATPAVTLSASTSGMANRDDNGEVGGRRSRKLGTSARAAAKHEDEVQIQTARSVVDEHHEVTKESSLIPFTDGFFKTRTGRMFHASLDCRSIRGKHCVPCFPLQEDKDPCRICALGIYQEWNAEGWIKAS